MVVATAPTNNTFIVINAVPPDGITTAAEYLVFILVPNPVLIVNVPVMLFNMVT